jgi:hypothetical protein
MTNNIEFNSGAINASECLSDAWELIKDNYWLYFGITIVSWLIMACVPFLNVFLLGPIWVGVYICFFTRMRNQPVEFGMMFKGFEKFVPAMVVGLIASIPEIIQQVLQMATNVVDLMNVFNRNQRGNFFLQSDSLIAGGLGIFIFILAIGLFIFYIAWKITFYFALGLVADYNLDIIDAIKLSARAAWSNVGGIISLAILSGLLGLLGALALCVGIFFVLPITFGAYAVAYRQVFPDRTTNNEMFNVPPPPSAYQNQFGNL